MEHRALLRNSLCWLLIWLAEPPSPPQERTRVVLRHTVAVRTTQGSTYVNGRAFTGTLISLQPNGRDTLQIQAFRHGRAHGLLKQYYPDGRLELIRSFQNGRKEGLLVAWWENGRKRLEYWFTDDQYEGEGKEWAINGQLVKRMHYQHGQEAGLQQQWTDRGDLWANYVVRRGRRYGIIGVKSCTTR